MLLRRGLSVLVAEERLNEDGNIQVLQVASRELGVCDHDDLALTLLVDGDNVAEVTGAAVDLDLVMQELLERSDIEDLVGGRLGSIDDELITFTLVTSFPDSLNHTRGKHTLWVTFSFFTPLVVFYISLFSAIHLPTAREESTSFSTDQQSKWGNIRWVPLCW